MVEEKEIRIGNWFRHKAVWSYRNDSDNPVEFDFQWESRDWFALGECTLSLESVEPIPISEERLTKLGLVKEGLDDDSPYEWWVNKKVDDYIRFWDFNQTGEWIASIGADYELTGLRYVHQIQNVYYSLTGA